MTLPTRLRAAFTLVELIVVMAVMVILIGLSAPAISSMQRAKDTGTAAYEIVDAFEQARIYAIANNTYTYVGLSEVDGTKSISVVPQSSPGVGRIGVAVIASKDGTMGMDNRNDLANSWKKAMVDNKAVNFVTVRKFQVFDNLHIMASTGQPPTSGNMARFNVQTKYILGHADFVSSGNAPLTTFTWPLGVAANTAQYTFTRVIGFNPQGTPSKFNSASPSLVSFFELALQPARGGITPVAPTDPNKSDYAVIALSGITGISRVYRP